MRILGIDPGTTQSGYVIYDTSSHSLHEKGKVDNEHLEIMLPFLKFDEAAIEILVSYGQPVGKETFETAYFIGKVFKTMENFGRTYHRYSRNEVCDSFGVVTGNGGKDTQLRAIIESKFGKSRKYVIGTKKFPGPLYGMVGSDMFSALALAMYHHCVRDHEGQNIYLRERFSYE